MAITEATNATYSYATHAFVSNGVCYYGMHDSTVDIAIDFTLTITNWDDSYIYFEPKELVDWRGLEKCFTGFKSNYKLNSSARYTIRQPSKDHRNVRRMRIQKMRSL